MTVKELEKGSATLIGDHALLKEEKLSPEDFNYYVAPGTEFILSITQKPKDD